MLNIIRKNGIRYELHNDKINELKKDNILLSSKIIDKRYSFTKCMEAPPRKKIKQDDSAIERIHIDQMSIMEILESAKCVVCYDIYEQTILDRGCKQAICLPCYEKIIKNECPVCRDELELAKLAPQSAKAVTKAIAKCDLMRELDEDETQEAAKKHMEFYQNHYQLRDPATFDSQYDFSDDSLVSNTSSDAESDLSDDDSNYSNSQASDSQSSIPEEDELSEADAFLSDSESDSQDEASDTYHDSSAIENEAADENPDLWPTATDFLSEVVTVISQYFSRQ